MSDTTGCARVRSSPIVFWVSLLSKCSLVWLQPTYRGRHCY